MSAGPFSEAAQIILNGIEDVRSEPQFTDQEHAVFIAGELVKAGVMATREQWGRP